MNNTSSVGLGMKWYKFFTKVRPWIIVALSLLFFLGSVDTFIPLLDLDFYGLFFFALNLVYIMGCIVNPVLQIILLIKSEDQSPSLLDFISGILIYDIIFAAYSYILQQYYNGVDMGTIIIASAISLILGYFIWYRCNMNYFKRLSITCAIENDGSQNYSLSQINEKNQSSPKSCGDFHVMGSDIALDPVAKEQSEPLSELKLETTSESPKKATIQASTSNAPVAPVIASSSSDKQRFCKYCGGAIDPETKKCSGCGKQFFKLPKASSTALIVTIVVLAILVGCGGIFASTYNKGIDAMNNQKFIVAQQHFDKLPFAESLFPDEHAYIEAGVLMEEGKFLEAYKAFYALEDTPVPVSITNKLKDKIYSIGVKEYATDDLSSAKDYFSAIYGHERSSDYLLLISCKGSSLKAEYSYDELLELIGFEDAADIILSNTEMLKKFLSGRWEDGEKYPNYFEMKADDDGSGYTSSYNLPSENVKGYFYLNDGIYSVGEIESDTTKYYKFSIIDKDTISVYCYKNGNTYTLNCVKRYEIAEGNSWTDQYNNALAEAKTVFAMRDQSALYHRKSCDKLEGILDPFNIEEAERLGFQPCPYCCSTKYNQPKNTTNDPWQDWIDNVIY